MNIKRIIEKDTQLQKKAEDKYERIKYLRIEAEAGEGDIKIITTGRGYVLKVSINSSLLKKNNKKIIEDIITAAFNNAKKIRDEKKYYIKKSSNST